VFVLNGDVNSSWVEKEFQTIDFGSKRLEKRFLRVMNDLSQEPEQSLWLASGSRINAKAAYRMIGNKEFTKENILSAHKDATNTRNKNTLQLINNNNANNNSKNNVLLAIQDTMAVNYDTHKKMVGLGYNCDKSLGINVHSCLLITPEGVTMGLVDQSTNTRETNKDIQSPHEKQKRKIQDKESGRWLQTMQTAQTNAPKNAKLIHIADREGDMYEWYNLALNTKQSFVIRAKHDRLTPEGTHIWEEVVRSKPRGQIKLFIAKNSKSQTEEREAILTLRYITTEIQRPLNRTEPELPSCLTVNLVNVAEEDPPEGVTPIEWMLTTNLELTSCEDALRVVDYYRQRWKIERFHFVLKSGCRIEGLQQHSVDRLEIVVLLYSLISVHIMMLTYLSRLYPELSCELFFSQSEWKMLYRAAKRTTVAPEVPFSMADAIGFVAVLGGFVGAPSDGPPGLKVVWMGLSKFFTLYAFREFI
jgi:hypothetical protein